MRRGAAGGAGHLDVPAGTRPGRRARPPAHPALLAKSVRLSPCGAVYRALREAVRTPRSGPAGAPRARPPPGPPRPRRAPARKPPGPNGHDSHDSPNNPQ
ncbi:hypothetical protein GCM10018793_20140 [Streptomyces sulfonofaciens]|uniref:Uncharacterized protein n=1 Tax=Streptomyces sulfonofaciens TaxID=68272 RepID=A0A919KXI3_9ACTN|nr:hypothetical protein GCM10018793_20140 [Streptomyces sulfonofaciens]